ncbi:MAG: DEAD/DEAH box helicase [Candidatus Micrarchaeia archaeon]
MNTAKAGWDSLLPYSKIVNTEKIEPREYQINIIKKVYSGKNSLIILPTGLGKTLIAVFAIAKSLYENKKALMLAPTKPLSDQHYESLKQILNVDSSAICLLTGKTSATKRERLIKDSKIIVATPQTVSNDIKNGRLDLSDFGCIIFDECHKAVGKYAYTYIADECWDKGVQIIGLTASPGSTKEKINRIINTFNIQSIEIRISTDPDVAPYVMDKSIKTFYIEKNPAILSISSLLLPVMEQKLAMLRSYGLCQYKDVNSIPKGRFIMLGDEIKRIQAKNFKFIAFFNYAYLLNLLYAYELATTQSIYAFTKYMDSLNERAEKSRVARSIISNESIRKAREFADAALQKGEEHPKMKFVCNLLAGELKGKSVIIFVQYRATIKKLVEIIRNSEIEAEPFIGKKEGITQEDQKKIIERFRNNEFKVLVATSIGEEGLDIPSVDAVIFYEPIPSEIRNIQRRGRAGRIKTGEIVILVTKGTKDERYLLISKMREKQMFETIQKIKMEMESGSYNSPAKQKRLRF